MKHLTLFLLCLVLMPVQAGSLSDLFGGSASADDEILHPDQAFHYEMKSVSAQEILIEWQIKEGYYLYKDRFEITLDGDHKDLQISEIIFPVGDMKDDPAFGRVETFTGLVELQLILENKLATPKAVTFNIVYQGCKEDSVCYPPVEKQSEVELPVAVNGSMEKPPIEKKETNNELLSEQDLISKDLQSKGLLSNLLIFFGFGVLLSLTPCVFPMIPILSGIIVGQSQQGQSSRAMTFLLSLAYVLAMAVTYAFLGMLAGSLDINLQAASQNVWVITTFSLVFVLLALSMFGFYELQLPASWQTRLNQIGQSKHSGSLLGAVIMGSVSAIIVGPCVAPPLAGALLYISQTGDALLGGAALFALGLGFGVPLLVIGASAGSVLPRAGQWMETIKAVFGVIMLGVAVWFLGRILPSYYALSLWSILFICTAVFMGAMDKLEDANSAQRLTKGLGIVLLVYGIIVMFGAVLGGENVLKPIPNHILRSTQGVIENESLTFKRIKSLQDLDNELQIANQQGKYVMLDFYADWCVACHELEDYTFNQKVVKQALGDVILLQADVTENDEIDKALMKKFQIFGPPAILFFEPGGGELRSSRLVGFVAAEEFVSHLDPIIQ